MKYALCLLLLSGCATPEFPKDDWTAGWQRKEKINSPKVVISDGVDVSRACWPLTDAVACVRQFPNVCAVYLNQEIQDVEPWVLHHEIKHCFGFTH